MLALYVQFAETKFQVFQLNKAIEFKIMYIINVYLIQIVIGLQGRLKKIMN